MKRINRRGALAVLAVAAAATTLCTSVLADPGHSGDNSWPYAQAEPVVLAAVGDIACEPETDESASTDPFYKCDGGNLAGMDAQFATADQIEAMQPDLVALLGDQQYQTGRLSDFENSLDKSYGAFKFLQRPTPGNHEYYAYAKSKGGHVVNEPAQNGLGYFEYYNGEDESGATRPAGQAGDTGHGWYSYDLGAWHIIALNAECSSAAFGNNCDPHSGLLGEETDWLAADLAADHSPCTLAYWHQATFTAIGTPSVEGTAADAWWNLLYSSGADVVLNGHEHVYARFQPQTPAGTVDTKKGLTQFIVGTGGEDFDTLARNSDGTFSNPNVVTGEDNAFGVLKLQLTHNGYSWNFQPVLAGPGKPASALDYQDTGSAGCHGPAH